MNLLSLFDSIAEVDADAADRFSTRRTAVKGLLDTGRKVGAAAAPVFFSSLFSAAYAGERGVRDTVTQVLQYALTLERLEAAFYTAGLTSPTLALSADDRQALLQISNDEDKHVQLLESLLAQLGSSSPPPQAYQFNKVYADVFSNRDTFLAVAQALEDTGVRAYKGRVAELQADRTVLEIALNIHSIEARHASHIRRLRGENAWITGKNTTIPTVTAQVNGVQLTVQGNTFYSAGTPASTFPAEDNTTQGGITGASYAGTGIPAARYTEAFDEPIDKDTVLAAISVLFVP